MEKSFQEYKKNYRNCKRDSWFNLALSVITFFLGGSLILNKIWIPNRITDEKEYLFICLALGFLTLATICLYQVYKSKKDEAQTTRIVASTLHGKDVACEE